MSFECGVCHASYRLDENQITADGVKVTCPRCLTFFFLKSGSALPKEEPVIEHIVSDGPAEVHTSPPAANEMTADQLLSDADIPSKPRPKRAPQTPPQKRRPPEPTEPEIPIKPQPSRNPPTKNTSSLTHQTFPKITRAELADYPADRPPETSFDRYLVVIALAFVTLLAGFLLHYYRVITLPALTSVQAPLPTPIPTIEPEPTPAHMPKYGFPVVDDVQMP